jgi:hypothetical protein
VNHTSYSWTQWSSPVIGDTSNTTKPLRLEVDYGRIPVYLRETQWKKLR